VGLAAPSPSTDHITGHQRLLEAGVKVLQIIQDSRMVQRCGVHIATADGGETP
jgi:hypothetical protein